MLYGIFSEHGPRCLCRSRTANIVSYVAHSDTKGQHTKMNKSPVVKVQLYQFN